MSWAGPVVRYHCPWCEWTYDDDGRGHAEVEPPGPDGIDFIEVVARVAKAHAQFVDAILLTHIITAHNLTKDEAIAKAKAERDLLTDQFEIPVAPI